jgi:CTP:molybdopterin cytidylyltransferase MocA
MCSITDIRVVTGYQSDRVAAVACCLGAAPVWNPHFAKGMWSSVAAGVSGLSSNISGFFFHPVDIPLVRTQTIRDLAEAFDTGSIVYPVFQGVRGHPPVIPSELIPVLLSYEGKGGLREFLSRHEERAVEIPTADRFILQDMDTPADYQYIVGSFERIGVLSPEECREFMVQKLRVPEPVWRHCQAVARTAEWIGRKLLAAGCRLDIGLIVSAALVHDLARRQSDHAVVGAGILEKMGCQKMADIVRVHMDLRVEADAPVTEAEVVFLADKLTDGDRPVSLEDRYQEKRKQFAGDSEAQLAVSARMEEARRSYRRIRAALGGLDYPFGFSS